jgi:DNA invertase Pin-like site-specific DNA recombinase
VSSQEWTPEAEAAAIASLRAASNHDGQQRVVLIYARQSVSDFDADGRLRGPSLEQQVDAVTQRSEFAGLCVEVFRDADRSGKETSRRGDYLRMLERIKGAAAGEIAAVASYDIDRLHRNDLEFFRFMAEMAERRILVFDNSGLVSAVDQLPWKVKAIVAQEERVKVARRVRDNLRYLKAHRTPPRGDSAGLSPH